MGGEFDGFVLSNIVSGRDNFISGGSSDLVGVVDREAFEEVFRL